MNFLVLDVETTIKNSGNPFSKENRLCLVSWATNTESGWFQIEHGDEPYGSKLDHIRSLLSQCNLIVGFNLKFDLHWLARYGIGVSDHRVWDCQLVDFMLDCQQNSYPSLDGCLAKRGLGSKHSDAVKAYWDSGIDTNDIPIEVLSEYGLRDAEATRDLFLHQYAEVGKQDKPFRSLVSLSNADLLVTAEMERNGTLLDVEGCKVQADGVVRDIDRISGTLHSFFNVDWVNLDSPQQLSSLLYGGEIERVTREPAGVFKSGQKIGQTRYAIKRETVKFPRLVEPIGLKKLDGGGYSTSEDSLRSLKPNGRTKGILDAILSRSKLEKLRGTYYQGLPELISELGWEGNYLHGQINHCVARTGRTSSSKPNMQNLPPEIDKLFRSRFGADGFIAAADAKGLEWVAVIYETQDETGIKEIWEGVDQHERNRERFGLPDKRVAKYFVFRIIFGGTAYTFATDPDFSWISAKESYWQPIVEEFYSKYKRIGESHIDWIRSSIETGGYTSSTGRRYKFYPFDNGRWPETTIKNYRVQGLGHDLMAIARVSLWRRLQPLKLRSKLINTVHDSIVLDIFKDEWYTIDRLIKEVFADIPANFEKLFDTKFNLPMKAEFKRLDGEEITI